MDVQMRVSHDDVLFIENLFDVFQDVIIDIPVDIRGGPDADRIFDGALSVTAQTGENRFVRKKVRVPERAHQGGLDLVRRTVVGCRDLDFHSPPAGRGGVGDLV